LGSRAPPCSHKDSLALTTRASSPWSALLGFGFRPKPWAGLVVGYKGMGVDFGKETDDVPIRQADLTCYGPICGLNLHWGER